MRPPKLYPSLALLLLFASWALAAYYWRALPDPVPTHWGLDGQPNGWLPMPWGALVGPLVTSFLYVLMGVLPAIDPRVSRWDSSQEVLPTLQAILTMFGCFVTAATLRAAVSPTHQLELWLFWLGLGLLFIGMGNLLPKVRSNFFVGIRTPWTLSSEDNWFRTHRMGGRLMVLGGLVLCAGGALPGPWSLGLLLGVLALTAVVPLAYSFWLFRQAQRAPS